MFPNWSYTEGICNWPPVEEKKILGNVRILKSCSAKKVTFLINDCLHTRSTNVQQQIHNGSLFTLAERELKNLKATLSHLNCITARKHDSKINVADLLVVAAFTGIDGNIAVTIAFPSGRIVAMLHHH